jgi:hypothetical protein
LAYIEWNTSNNQAVVHDCLVSFSPLSEVDLRFHNKHLHGWGIVCGLQVNCGGDRTEVTVKRGYAIDCEGYDVLLRCDASVSLVAEAQAQCLLDSNGNGNVSLILQRDGSFSVEKEDASKETLGSFFQGTIWVDFWDKCVQPLVSFFTSQFSSKSGSANVPVGPGQQRMDTFINLADQLVNPVSGQYLFVSPEEDQILSAFYAGLKQVLESRTFCGLFDNARPFPTYPFTSLNIHSIFGSGNHTRIRINPAGTLACTVAGPSSSGGDNTIHVYDVKNMVMTAEVPFPGQTGAIVQDVAFSADGTQLYATALLGQSSEVAVFAVQGSNVAWNGGTIQGFGGQLVTLAVSDGNVYAVARGQGLCQITPQGGTVIIAQVGPVFNAFGHLVIGSGLAWMTANSASNSYTGVYDSVWMVNLSDPSSEVSFQLTDSSKTARTGTPGDDIAIAVDPAEGFTKLYVVVDPTGTETTKQLLVFTAAAAGANTAAGVPQGVLTHTLDLEQNTAISLAFNPANAYLLLGYAENNWISVLDPSSDTLSTYQTQEPLCAVPTELSPQSIALGPYSDPSSQTVYALNVANSTISAIPATMLVPSPSVTVSLTELATYRNGVLEAFADVLGVFLEDLKDCFCDRILVDCPHCDGDDQLYLGDIQIRNSEVYRICNLSRRRYVKTFPTVGYWLSVVPILPVLKWLVGRFCCAVLPDYFSKFQAGQERGADRLTSSQIISANSFVQQINLASLAGAQLTKLSTTRTLATDSISAAVFNFKPAAAALVNQGDVVGQQAQVASQRLAAAKIVVDSVQPYDATAAATNVTASLGAPTSLPPGSHVVLYEQNGVVRYYTLTPQPTPAVQDLTTQVQAQQVTLSSLEQSHQLVAEQQKAIAAHEQEIASLKTSLSQLQQAHAARDQELVTLKNQVQDVLKAPPRGRKPPNG